jgi:hypothetical protein
MLDDETGHGFGSGRASDRQFEPLDELVDRHPAGDQQRAVGSLDECESRRQIGHRKRSVGLTVAE